MSSADKAQAIFEELSDFTREEMRAHQVPGVALGIVFDGRDFLAGIGVTSVDHPLPVDPDTLFQIGSTTKTVTATLAMRLAADGKLNLDAPVRRYLPKLRLADEDTASRVTMRHLLTHSGGWVGDYFEDTGDGEDALSKYVAKIARLDQLTPLGEHYSYCNSGFNLAGRVLEVLSEKSYESAVTERVLSRLGMKHSFIHPKDVMLHRFAAGHRLADGKVEVSRPWPLPRSNNPAGGVASSARDQLKYARFHLQAGGPSTDALLSGAAIAQMQTPVRDGPTGRKQGLGWILREVQGARLVLHGGATNGQQSAFLMAPDAGFAITVLTNSMSGARLHTNAVKFALERYLGVIDADPEPIEAPRAQLEAFTGRYGGAMQDLEVKLDDEGLSLTITPNESAPRLSEAAPPVQTYRIAPCGVDRFVGVSGLARGQEGELVRTFAGEKPWLRWGLRLYRPGAKREVGRTIRGKGGGT
jgi:CubicO group peptidase (beta-lactamase class C family)